MNDTYATLCLIFTPPPKLTVSYWADNYRILSPEDSAEPGRWNTDRAPYQREIMDAVTDPEIEDVVIMSSAQVGKTAIFLNIIGYYIDYDPAPILCIQPTKEMAESFSKDRLATMIRDCDRLHEKVSDTKSRDSGNTIGHKTFPSGHITMLGANSPTGLSGRPIRIFLADEVDRYPVSAGIEGDPIKLGEKRTATFWNRKKIKFSTPSIKGFSRIEAEYERGTMEQYHLPCPECGHYQPLTWAQIHFETEQHACSRCGSLNDEVLWKYSNPKGKGKWKAQRKAKGIRSFHINELYSPWRRWGEIIKDFHEAKAGGTEELKVWVNTSLGESWEEAGDEIEIKYLEKRREYYDSELPDGTLMLTAGVDVQKDRLEIEVVGWGEGKESWGVDYKAFIGNPAEEDVWEQLDKYLLKNFRYSDGCGLTIACTCVDSGYKTTEVYDFCKPREHRRVFAIKGVEGFGKIFIGNPTRRNRKNTPMFPLGVDTGKELLFSRLKIEHEGAGYCHFPRESDRGYGEQYFKGLTSERLVTRYNKGKKRLVWEKRPGARNEPLDLRNYATAAMEIVNPDFEKLKNMRKKESAPIIATRRRQISRGVSL